MSIKNQRLLLDGHIEGLNLPNCKVLEFEDNDYTGTNFERPKVQELLELVQTGGVNCVIVKDFSRFGRNSMLQAEIEADNKYKQSAASFLRTVKRYTDIEELTPIILNELVEKIVVHQAQGVGKNRTQQLEIHYNFVGVLDTPEVAALPQSVTVDTRQGVAVEYITHKAG